MEIGLEAQHVMADQGSDTNVIANWLVEKLSFERRPLADNIAIGTADGNTALYKQYTSFHIDVGGIWRMVDALVRPHNDHGHNQAIMLGLPSLHIVNVVIDVKNSSITVGDEGIGEERVIIETPRFTTSKYHTLTLYSTDSKYKKQIETVEKNLKNKDPRI